MIKNITPMSHNNQIYFCEECKTYTENCNHIKITGYDSSISEIYKILNNLKINEVGSIILEKKEILLKRIENVKEEKAYFISQLELENNKELSLEIKFLRNSEKLFSLHLFQIPSTGYIWEFDKSFDLNKIKLLKEDYNENNNISKFNFKLLSKENFSFKLTRCRPWLFKSTILNELNINCILIDE